MAETHAAAVPAEQQDVFPSGEPVSFDEFSRFRKAGEVPERFKSAEKAEEQAPADAPEETVVEPEGEKPESEPDSEPEEAQEPPQKPVSPAQKRILQLLAEKKELQRRLEAATPPQPQAQPEQAPQPQYTRQKPAIDAKDDKGAPKYQTYEEYVEDLADWKAEQQVARYKQEQAQAEQLRALKVKLDEARERYEDADEVIFPAAQTIKDAQIPMAVKEVFAQSDLFPDLCYVVGSDPDELKKFVSLAQSNPRAALAKVFEYERGIREELKNGKEAENGKAPERKTSAPKPPAPVSGGTSRGFDVSDESLSADEWMRKRNADIERRRKAVGRS